MHYKTILLGLLEQRPHYSEQLRQQGTLLETMVSLAHELKSNHEQWKLQLAEAKPESDPIQTASEAMERAVADLESRLPCESIADEGDELSLDGAMAYLKRHTPKKPN